MQSETDTTLSAKCLNPAGSSPNKNGFLLGDCTIIYRYLKSISQKSDIQNRTKMGFKKNMACLRKLKPTLSPSASIFSTYTWRGVRSTSQWIPGHPFPPEKLTVMSLPSACHRAILRTQTFDGRLWGQPWWDGRDFQGHPFFGKRPFVSEKQLGRGVFVLCEFFRWWLRF